MINLLPPDYKNSIKFSRYNIKLLWYCAMVLAVTAALVGIMFFGVALVKADETKLIQDIESKELSLSQRGGVEAEARVLAADINTISALLDKSVNFSDLIQNIGAVIPNGARLTGLSLTGDDESPLQITAVTDSQTKAAVLRQNIEDSILFKGADIQTIAPVDVAGTRQFTTVIVTAFTSAAEQAAAEAAGSQN